MFDFPANTSRSLGSPPPTSNFITTMPRTKLVPRKPYGRGKQLATPKAREYPPQQIRVDAATYASEDEEAEAYEVSDLIDNF